MAIKEQDEQGGKRNGWPLALTWDPAAPPLVFLYWRGASAVTRGLCLVETRADLACDYECWLDVPFRHWHPCATIRTRHLVMLSPTAHAARRQPRCFSVSRAEADVDALPTLAACVYDVGLAVRATSPRAITLGETFKINIAQTQRQREDETRHGSGSGPSGFQSWPAIRRMPRRLSERLPDEARRWVLGGRLDGRRIFSCQGVVLGLYKCNL